MYTFLLAALCCYSMLPVESAGPSKKQSDLPKDCSALVLEVNLTSTPCPSLSAFSVLVNAVVNPADPEWNTPQNRDWLENTLDDFCTTDCLTYTVEYYLQNCSGGPNEDLINLYQNYYCGSNTSDTHVYCLVAAMNYMADTTSFLDTVLQCSAYINADNFDFCSPACTEVLQDIQNELGCCAVNLFNTTTDSPFAELEAAFERCGLSLIPADMCSGVIGTTIISLLLLPLATSLSLLCFI